MTEACQPEYAAAPPLRSRSATAATGVSVFKPGIAAGVSLAALAGMTLASDGLPDARMALLCVGCIMLAAMGAGASNSVLDAGIDRRMPRVGRRAEALGRLGAGPVMAASSAMILAALAVSYTMFGLLTASLILAAVLSYSILYTLYLKRRSPYGMVPGGIPGALPVLIGYSAASHAIGLDGLVLFVVMLLWQPPHFLALALEYGPEYKAAGIPVMPVALGERYTKVFMFFYLTALVPVSVSLWWLGYASEIFALLACVFGVLYSWACYVNVIRSRRYGRAFAASIIYITALLAGLIADVGVSGA